MSERESIAGSARFLIDANLPSHLAALLNARGHDAEHVRAVGLGGHLDAEVYAYAQATRRTIITTDLGLGDIRAYPPPHAGIIIVRLPDTFPILNRLRAILNALTTLEHQPLRDTVATIEMGCVRVRGAS